MTHAAAPAGPPCDLHLHSTCSDGLLGPSEMVDLAADAGLGLISLTDHDTVDGLDEAHRAAERRGVELVPGLELTCRHARLGTLHVLGYGIDADDPALLELLSEAARERHGRCERILEALAGVGVRLTLEDVEERARGACLGRPHVADALVARGHVRSRQEAFDRYLADGRVGDVPRPAPDGAQGIEAIHAAGGLAVLAHPARRWDGDLVRELVGLGLDGLEVVHPSHASTDVRTFTHLARRYGLLATGGSDCHGDDKGRAALAGLSVPAAHGAALTARLDELGSRHPRAGGRRVSA